MYKYRCTDVGPTHLGQPECGVFYTTRWLGDAPYCPDCGSDEQVEFLGEVELLEVEA